MKFGLAASILLLPGFLATSIVQDYWLWRAHHSWQKESPETYWAWTFISLFLLIFIIKRLRNN